jgi:alkylation response protein AidB-like acyl-CoA dehydrogenase
MFIDLTDDQRKLRDELREYFRTLVTPAERAELTEELNGAAYAAIAKRMGSDGWLGVGWPVEYGGRGYGPVEQQIFVNEVNRAEIPYPVITLQTVGPTIMRFGNAEQREFFLPRILAGELHFAVGYTEPSAGTDLASLRTRAVLDGEEYVVNGQKLYTSGGHTADYIWLACRTAPDAPKHQGISILIVDTQSPGFSWTPIITSDGRHHTNATYYSDVRVPVDRRVGEENAGWRMITTQLNHERIALGPAGALARFLDRFLVWARRPGPERPGAGGTPTGWRPLDEPAVRRVAAEVYAAVTVNQLFNWQVAAEMDAGRYGVAEASATKVFGSESQQELGRLIADVVARYGDPGDPDTDELQRWVDRAAKGSLVLTFGGGVNEVQRELIATLGLGLPRVPR